jgi:hypothetical protein
MVTYKPTHQMVGQNAQSIEYELRKIKEKLDDLESRLAALETP